MTGVVAEVRAAVLEGNSFYYIRLEGGESFYAVSVADSELAVIVNPGDTVTISFAGTAGDPILAAKSLEIVSRDAVQATPDTTQAVDPAANTDGTAEAPQAETNAPTGEGAEANTAV